MTHTRPDITAVLEAHGATNIPTREGWVPMRCPYHGDTTASASVNLKLQAFKCHACDVKGDAYSLIQQHDGCDFQTALTIGDNLTPAATQPDRPRRRLEPLFG